MNEAPGAMRALRERFIEFHQEVIVCFIDFEKGIDRVNRTKLMKIMKDFGID